MTSLVRRLGRRIGRRGGVLLLLAVVYAIFGVQSLIDPAHGATRFVFYATLPAALRSVLWLGTAALGIVAAFLKRGRDGFGFAALTVAPAIVAVYYLWSFVGFLFGLTPWGLGWAYAGPWLGLLTLLLIVSGWVEVQPEAPESHRVSVVVIDEEGE